MDVERGAAAGCGILVDKGERRGAARQGICTECMRGARGRRMRRWNGWKAALESGVQSGTAAAAVNLRSTLPSLST